MAAAENDDHKLVVPTRGGVEEIVLMVMRTSTESLQVGVRGIAPVVQGLATELTRDEARWLGERLITYADGGHLRLPSD